ncbi:hypothetical protein RHA1_ro08379 (plasmid) [Rhodococcus jostii RHA1]|uniref:Uncharacterized protein n=1 Tax=Rhodococcus jostii (strain RHA1) TaxID=101510 RepID=Q0RZ63_RHOJR|nr:hypothetical protein RHA1_ro08379 [Rhodococcus jostii RHA1]
MGDQGAQRGFRVGDQVDRVGVARRDHAAVDVDLHAAGLPVRGQELGAGEGRADGQQGVAAGHHLVGRAGTQQADGSGDPGRSTLHVYDLPPGNADAH